MATVQEVLELIIDDVEYALHATTEAERTEVLQDVAQIAFAIAFEDITERRPDTTMRDEQFVASMADAFDNTNPDGTSEQVERVATVIATAAVNAATLAGAGVGPGVTWNTQRDDRVRDLHRPLDGVTQPAGTPFMVGGTPLLYPGQPVGPPEGWINCRCYLTVAATASGVLSDQGGEMTDTLEANPDFAEVASLKIDTPLTVVSNGSEISNTNGVISLVAVSDKPWSSFSASDYTIEQWRRACLLKMPGGNPESKSTYKLPVREPGGALNRNGVHAAASRMGSTHAPPEAIAAAKRKLRGLYRQLGEDPPESIAASGDEETRAVEPLVAVDTHDAPGWLTNPIDTERLRRYWTRGPGAAKIAWGAPGDFNRCRAQLGKYVHNPSWLAGTCANLHYVALGFWPGQGPHAAGEIPEHEHLNAEERAVYDAFQAADEAVTAAAVDFGDLPPLAWFEDPQFSAEMPLTIDADGHIYGHAATWGQCHLGYEDRCVTAPNSERGYTHFRTGAVRTDGGLVSVGSITMDTGHADKPLGHSAAVAHYDNTGLVVADVAAGEDEYGIWLNGQLRPGLPPEKVRALQAAKISGDWREIGGKLEFVAALAVNVPGFPVPRPDIALAASGERIVTLVAAAIVDVDPNAEQADFIAELVVGKIDERRRRALRASALVKEINTLRAEALVAASG